MPLEAQTIHRADLAVLTPSRESSLSHRLCVGEETGAWSRPWLPRAPPLTEGKSMGMGWPRWPGAVPWTHLHPDTGHCVLRRQRQRWAGLWASVPGGSPWEACGPGPWFSQGGHLGQAGAVPRPRLVSVFTRNTYPFRGTPLTFPVIFESGLGSTSCSWNAAQTTGSWDLVPHGPG